MNRTINILIACLILLSCASITASPAKPESIAHEFHKLKYSYAFALSDDKTMLFEQAEFESTDNSFSRTSKSGYKSPAKAFLIPLESFASRSSYWI